MVGVTQRPLLASSGARTGLVIALIVVAATATSACAVLENLGAFSEAPCSGGVCTDAGESGTDDGGWDQDVVAADAPLADAGVVGPDGEPDDFFGEDCIQGEVYSTSFQSDPFGSGVWTGIAGMATYDSAAHELDLTGSTGNQAQAWIGARPNWSNYTISVRLTITLQHAPDGNAGINFRMSNPGSTNYSGTMYYAGISPTEVQLGTENNGTYTLLNSATLSINAATSHVLTVTALGVSLVVNVDGTNYILWTDSTGPDGGPAFSTGGFGLRTYEDTAAYKSITVTCKN
jgi:hypothetical protein